MAEPPAHDYAPRSCAQMDRHSHRYAPHGGATRRCTCGSRKFHLNAGGILDVQVACATCGRMNRGATEYERGRLDAVRH